MKGYVSIREIAKRWGGSSRWATQYVQDGRVPGYERFEHSWVIPEDAEKPPRMKPGVKTRAKSGFSEADKE